MQERDAKYVAELSAMQSSHEDEVARLKKEHTTALSQRVSDSAGKDTQYKADLAQREQQHAAVVK